MAEKVKKHDQIHRFGGFKALIPAVVAVAHHDLLQVLFGKALAMSDRIFLYMEKERRRWQGRQTQNARGRKASSRGRVR